MRDLYIANKNYSSWSLRPWLLMKQLDIPFTEQLVPFADQDSFAKFRSFSPSGKVPCLVQHNTVIWDSLAIVEYLYEHYPQVWPSDRRVRAWARCAAAEIHANFNALRNICSMNCGLRLTLHEQSPALLRDLARLQELILEGLEKFGGPYLCGEHFTAADAFYAPVAFRIQSYGLTLDPTVSFYFERLLSLAPMLDWYEQALAEPWLDRAHDDALLEYATVTADLRTQLSR